MSYDPSSFWQDVLSVRGDLTGVGHGGYGERYNRALYRTKERAVRRALARNGIELAGKRVLDLGCGVGYFNRVARALGATGYTGVDITRAAREIVEKLDPEAQIVTADLTEPLELGMFDAVFMFDVAYHIVDPARLEIAIANAWSFVAPGGHLLLVDTFERDDLVPVMDEGGVEHVVFHKRADYDRMLFEKSDAELRDVVPMYWAFNRPIVGRRFPWTSERLSWHLRHRFFESPPVLRAMELVDRVAVPRVRRNASLKIAVVRKG